MIKKILFVAFAIILVACNTNKKEKETSLNVPFQKFELKNGLQVVMHIDKSDPVVAVELMAHVGSAREIAGRTGFAHLFEHLLFLESENLGKGGLDKMTARIGGSGANGSTSRDRTNYLQTVPNDALEKMIWAEADKLGWFINTVTDPVLAKEKQVVKNEKRQSYDNRPYGHNQVIIDRNLYPKNHPYNWQVIGSLEDLQNAKLEDVKTFFKKWYVPNNATLVLSGDFDPVQAKKWVEKYFDEIPRGDEITPLEKRPGVVKETKLLYYEDNFARLPMLTFAWPTVELYNKDSYALNILTQYLSQGKKAPLNQVLVDDLKLTSSTSMYNRSSELAGQTQLGVRGFANVDLNEINNGIQKAFEKFEKEGISDKDLNRIKAGLETRFYSSLSSVLGKGTSLASFNTYANDPGFINKEINYTLGVTKEDVMRVYNTYIKNKNFIATSFVPKGMEKLALKNSKEAIIKEEKIVQGAEENFDPKIAAKYKKTPSTFDRSIEPPYGKSPELSVPTVWKNELSNGIKVFGIENSEVPLVQFNLVIDGGQLLEKMDKLGVANLTASLMNRGTKNKTVAQLEEAIQELGAFIRVSSSTENITISGTTLAKNYSKTVALIEEMLLEPRWDETEFELLKKSVVGNLRQQKASPTTIANNVYNELIYGKDNIRSKNTLGTIESVDNSTLDDLKSFYTNYISPSVAKMHIVGDIKRDDVLASLSNLNAKWESKNVEIPIYKTPEAPNKPTVYFYDVPNAKQSVINFGAPALAATDKDFYPATVMNYILGGGGFASQLTQELREGKGYTYGIYSGFSGTKAVGPFTISSRVRTNVTLESAQLVKKIITDYPKNYSEKDLATTKGFLIKSNARRFETMYAKLNMLQNMSAYGFSSDYIKDREKIVTEMTIEKIQELSRKYVNPNKMIWLFVGDAETQLDRLNELGFGQPVLLNKTKEKIKH
ncbi:putative zinc protease [Polaribacter huanghezhanensis]|uniref:M16 family metallopeptidase n=1 Tax=Polaribacter huanghezhanensis TaxID=1354726 RepID=UPI002647AE7D|nr:pitrilysin family protein [Polaribacter huanghezhanensis]WKD85122.1 putative zinc protease [Polaribacter huanghezhanensis]